MLEEVQYHPETWEEFIQFWIQEKVAYREEEVYTEVRLRTDGSLIYSRKYYPVHPIGSSNRPYLEEKMMSDIKYLLLKNNS